MSDLATTNSNASTDLSGKMSEERLVGGAFVVFCLVGTLFFSSVVEQILSAMRYNNFLIFDVLPLASLLGFILSLAVVIPCYFARKIHEASLHVATELKRVTWPSAAETTASTIAVIVVSLISALVLLCYDFLSAKIMSSWIPWVIRKIVGS